MNHFHAMSQMTPIPNNMRQSNIKKKGLTKQKPQFFNSSKTDTTYR